MGDHFYFHYDFTMSEKSRQPSVTLDTKNIQSHFYVHMQKIVDTTQQEECSDQNYLEQQSKGK